MVKRCIFKLNNKKAKSLLFPIVIFIVLNLMFFGLLLMFVFKSSSGALVYEQSYAKQIALILDKAEPVMQITIDFEKALEIAEKNRMTSEEKEDLVSFRDNKVIVKLDKKGGYGFEYFSDYYITSYFDGNDLIITVNERGENV